jgi:hypothetical protein
MTHGDKAKAKTGKSSQASAVKKSSPAKETGRKGVETKGAGKSAPKSAGKGEAGGKAKIPIRKAGSEKGGAAAAKAVAAPGKESAAKAVKGRAEESPAFTNPVVGTAFKHALKKYPNAFRKLTD